MYFDSLYALFAGSSGFGFKGNFGFLVLLAVELVPLTAPVAF
jgi:hypothetical protein